MAFIVMTISIECFYTERRYAECRDYLNVMLSVIMRNSIMLSVIMMNVVMLNVVAPERLVKEVIIKALSLLIVLQKLT